MSHTVSGPQAGVAAGNGNSYPAVGRAGEIALFWYQRSPQFYAEPMVRALSGLDFGRINVLMDLAFGADDRWHISEDDDTLAKLCWFRTAETWLRWIADQVSKGLLWVDENGFYVLSHRLFPHVPGYPRAIAPLQSLQNLQSRAALDPNRQTLYRSLMIPNERQAVCREWLRFVERLAAEGIAAPDKADRRRYTEAREEFQAVFLGHLRRDLKPAAALEESLPELFPLFRRLAENQAERERQAREREAQQAADVTPERGTDSRAAAGDDVTSAAGRGPSDVTNGAAASAEMAAFFGDVTTDDPDNVTPDASRDSDSERKNQRESQTQNNNNSLVQTDARDTDENVTNSEGAPPSGGAIGVTHGEKAVVVVLLTTFGLWDQDAEAHAEWLTEEDTRMYLFWIRDQSGLDKPASVLNAHLHKRTPVPAEYRRRYLQEKAEREAEQKRAEQTALDAETERLRAAEWKKRLAAFLGSLPESELDAIRKEAADKLHPMLRDRLQKAMEAGGPLPPMVSEPLEAAKWEIVAKRMEAQG